MGKIEKDTKSDDTSLFVTKQYVSNGHPLHFHKCLEIYGVLKGKAVVKIAGESKVLTDGQMAIIDRLENHSYEMTEEAEIICFHIGIRYLSNFVAVYPDKRLPYWLLDAEYNKVLLEYIRSVMGITEEPIPELKRMGITCQLFSDIIEHYGLIERSANIEKDDELITSIIQYIYDHYSDNITLETLSKVFYISPKALSKKIGKHLNVDLRVFVNDIRIQKAVKMLDEPENQNKSLDEIALECGFNNMGTFYRSYERNFDRRFIRKNG